MTQPTSAAGEPQDRTPSTPTTDAGFMTFADLVAAVEARAGDGPLVEGPEWARADIRTGGAEYERLAHALRETRDAIAEAHLDEAESAYLTDRVAEIADYARSIKAPPGRRVWSNRFDLPVRGSALPPRMEDLRIDPAHGRVECRVTFGTSYVGFGEAAHGGAIAMLFDEILGMCANTGRPISRTAYLHVDYRNLTQLNHPHTVSGRIDRLEGRKRFVVAELRRVPDDGSDGPGPVTAEAEGLFIELRAGQN